MDIKTHCPKCQAEFLTELSEQLLTELGLQQKLPESEAKLAEDAAKLQEDYAKGVEEAVNLKEEVERLEGPEHEKEVFRTFLNNLPDDDSEEAAVAKVELGRKLGLVKMFQEAEKEEVKEPVPVAEVKDSKPDVVYKDPHDSSYEKVTGLPIWVLKSAVETS